MNKIVSYEVCYFTFLCSMQKYATTISYAVWTYIQKISVACTTRKCMSTTHCKSGMCITSTLASDSLHELRTQLSVGIAGYTTTQDKAANIRRFWIYLDTTKFKHLLHKWICSKRHELAIQWPKTNRATGHGSWHIVSQRDNLFDTA